MSAEESFQVVPPDLPVPDFTEVFDEAPVPLLLLTPDLVIVRANRARLEATATTLEHNVGRGLFELFPINPADPAADGLVNLRASLERVRETGRPHTMAIQKYDIRMPGGGYEERYWSPRNVPILDGRGRVAFLLHRSDDITDYLRDRDAAREAAASGARWRERAEQVEADLFERARELEDLNRRLSEAVEREQRSGRWLAGLAETALALSGAEDVGDLLRRAAEHGQRAVEADGLVLARTVAGRLEVHGLDARGGAPAHHLDLTSSAPLALVASGAVPALDSRGAAGGSSAAGSPTGADAEAWTGAWADWSVLPLRAGERLLGALGVGWRQQQTFGAQEQRLVRALAAQVAQALDRVGRLEQERHRARATRSLAESLQRSLLTDPVQADDLEIAVRYLPAVADAQVGGDWYDAFLLPDGCTTVVVGDVVGHDREAAAVMAQVRNVLRGLAQAVVQPPSAMLGALDRAMENLAVGGMATAVLAKVEQDEASAARGERVLRWSNAGHPPPLLLHPDGTAELLTSSPELMLGILTDGVRSDHRAVLRRGDTVLLYTDGLVERRGASIDDGLRWLLGVAGRHAGLPPQELADAVLAELTGTYGEAVDDDVALLALHAG
ncbi:SpoIIE family protein phosphatase [Kineococcus sp. SYSU DK006]|uniref:SpoIIE family protein phosphatase n=1 Tax=Kineococcus sp. SYSU DK006 TaxID=3383127 RepID=UPI003D7E211B